jgi:hypothetical protein
MRQPNTSFRVSEAVGAFRQSQQFNFDGTDFECNGDDEHGIDAAILEAELILPTNTERTGWLTTFVELAYVAAMIQLGHYLEYERTSWAGWLTGLTIFTSFWSTWIQFTAYQSCIVDSGVLEKVWAFVHCCAMLMMGGYVNALHYCSSMEKKYGPGTVCVDHNSIGGGNHTNTIVPTHRHLGMFPYRQHPGMFHHRRHLAAADGTGHYDFQVHHNIFTVGMALSRWSLAMMYALSCVSSGLKYRNILRTGSALFATTMLILTTAAAFNVSTETSATVMFGCSMLEFLVVHLLVSRPCAFSVNRLDLAELIENCDVEHVAHNLGQFLFIAIGVSGGM